MTEQQITEHGVSQILNNADAAAPLGVIVQVLAMKPIANSRYTCILSDGSASTKAMLPMSLSTSIESEQLKNLGLIRVLSYTCSSVAEQKVVVLTQCEIVCAALDKEVGSVETKPELKPKGSAVVKSAAQIVEEEQGRAAPAARMGISRRVHPLVSLTPYQGSWTIKVRVTGKGPLRSYRNARGEGSVFNVELTDEDGTQIQATMFKEAAEKFYSVFELGKVYYISKGSLRVANKQFSTVRNDYEMTLNIGSEVEEVLGEDTKSSPIPSIKLSNLVKIENLTSFVNRKELIDIIGVVHSVSSSASVRRKADNTEFVKREMTMLDQSMKTVTVSLWSSLADEAAKLLDVVGEGPIVLIRALRVSDFQGVSLSTTSKSMLWINPDVEEARELRAWYDESGKEATVTSIGSTLPGGSGRTYSSYDDRCVLSSITPSVGEEKAAFFNVRACVSYIKPDQMMWYMACQQCNRKVTEESSKFWCEGCQKHFDSFSRRYIMSAKITDTSGEVWASAFNEQAEQLLGVPAEGLADLRSQDDKLYEAQLKAAAWMPKVFRLKVSQSEYMGEKRQRTVITSMNDVDWLGESKLLLQQIEGDVAPAAAAAGAPRSIF